jgi:hypothetical protein
MSAQSHDSMQITMQHEHFNQHGHSHIPRNCLAVGARSKHPASSKPTAFEEAGPGRVPEFFYSAFPAEQTASCTAALPCGIHLAITTETLRACMRSAYAHIVTSLIGIGFVLCCLLSALCLMYLHGVHFESMTGNPLPAREWFARIPLIRGQPFRKARNQQLIRHLYVLLHPRLHLLLCRHCGRPS